jgi:hypothetical protein
MLKTSSPAKNKLIRMRGKQKYLAYEEFGVEGGAGL